MLENGFCSGAERPAPGQSLTRCGMIPVWR